MPAILFFSLQSLRSSQEAHNALRAVLPMQELLAGVLSRLEPMLGLLCQQGFGPLEADYYAAWLHSGQEVGASRAGRGLGCGAPCGGVQTLW